MPATSAPFGLRPYKVSPSGSGGIYANPYKIASGYAANIFKGSGVKLATSGTIQVAAAGEAMLGVFAGVEYTDTTSKVRVYQKHWPASTSAEDIVAYVYDDPDIVYEIQADAAMDAVDLGEMADFPAAADDTGSTVTGISSAMLDADVATTTAQFQVLGLSPQVDNDWADSFPIVLVRIAEHQLRPAVSAGV